jgi:glycosyltransferase involved in cell wall biosynthesis
MKKLGIIIKTYNEGANIDRAIRSALLAVAPYGGEVIVADSASVDQTIARALCFPVMVVRILNAAERCCGVGPQLGYQYSNCEYIYILDGDMELDAAFLEKAKALLDSDRSLAGVGGYVREIHVHNLEFEARVRRQKKWQPRDEPTYVDHLVGGALYRRAAIEDVRYFSDRNLRAFEEYDLGKRLRAKGWRLIRLPDHAADHYGYRINTLRLLLHRASSGYIFGIGDLLRAAIHGGYLRQLLAELRAMHLAIGVLLYWCLGFPIALFINPTIWTFVIFLSGMLLAVMVMAIRSRSLKLAFFNVLSWHMIAIGLLLGFVRRRRSPTEEIQSQVLRGISMLKIGKE